VAVTIHWRDTKRPNRT